MYTGPKNHHPDQGPALITNVRIVAGLHHVKFRFSKFRNLSGFRAVTARLVTEDNPSPSPSGPPLLSGLPTGSIASAKVPRVGSITWRRQMLVIEQLADAATGTKRARTQGAKPVRLPKGATAMAAVDHQLPVTNSSPSYHPPARMRVLLARRALAPP